MQTSDSDKKTEAARRNALMDVTWCTSRPVMAGLKKKKKSWNIIQSPLWDFHCGITIVVLLGCCWGVGQPIRTVSEGQQICIGPHYQHMMESADGHIMDLPDFFWMPGTLISICNTCWETE